MEGTFTYRQLFAPLEGKSSELTRADALSHISQRGWWSYKVLKSKIALEPSEIALLVEKASTWLPSEDHCMEILGVEGIPVSMRLQIVHRVIKVLKPGNNSVAALWALRGHVFPKEAPMTSEERRLLLNTFKRPGCGSRLDNYYSYGLVEEYRPDYGNYGACISTEEMKELLPFALEHAYSNWYDAGKMLEFEHVSEFITAEQRAKLEEISKKVPNAV